MSLKEKSKTAFDIAYQVEHTMLNWDKQFVPIEEAQFWCDLNTKHCRDAEKLSLQYKQLLEAFTEIIDGLTEKLPIAQKTITYDPKTKEDWIIEVPEMYDYQRFFDWIDANLTRWKQTPHPPVSH